MAPTSATDYTLPGDDARLCAILGTDKFIFRSVPVYREFLGRPGWRTPTCYQIFARFDDVLEIFHDPTRSRT